MKRKPLSEDRFAPTWEGRCWLDWGPIEVDTHKLREAGGFKVLSYHVFADKKCMNIRYSSTKLWSLRSRTLLEEMKSYDADIICLQDVDHFNDWWQPQLMFIGYDTIWKQRTSKYFDHSEGVVIAYKRDLFQLFKTVHIELNHAADQESTPVQRLCGTDNVAIVAFLQPWIPNFLESAVCVCSAMFYEGDYALGETDVRALQATYLVKCIEYENRNLHLPIVIGASLNDEPDSAAYHILRTGRKQLMPSVPQKVHQPLVKPFSRASVKVYWKPAEVTEADPPVLQYVISWRPGGSTDMGFCLSKKVDSGDCLQYATTVNEAGIRSTVALELRSALVSGLSAETPFEFKVAAMNEVGLGDWSEASMPIVLENPRKVWICVSYFHHTDWSRKAAPKDPLHRLRDVTGVMEMREVMAMGNQDWDVDAAYNVDVNDPMTCLTPRTLEGVPDKQISSTRILPISTNPREGWRAQLNGEMTPALRSEIESAKRIMKSVIMGPTGYHPSVSDTVSSKRAIYDLAVVKKYKEGVTHLMDGGNSVATEDKTFPDSSQDDGSFLGKTALGDSVEDLNSINQKFSSSESICSAAVEIVQHTQSHSEPGGSNNDDDYSAGEDTFKYKDDEFEDDNDDEMRSTSVSGTGTNLASREDASYGHASMANQAGTAYSSTQNKLNDLMLNDGTITTVNEESTWEIRGSTADGAIGSAIVGSRYGEMLNAGGARARKMNDDVIIDLKEAVEAIGKPNRRHVHGLNLRSVYEYYGLAGEPLYTTSVPEKKNYKGVRCLDYIFFSGSSLRPSKILSIPLLSTLSGDNPMEAIMGPDPYWLRPTPTIRDLFDNHHSKLPQLSTKSGKPSKGELEAMKRRLADLLKGDIPVTALWGGQWVPFSSPCTTRIHSWLPNDSFASSHISLCAHFQINEDYKATEWV